MRPLLLAAATFSLAGCIPYHSHDAPSVAGRVLSRTTGKPIAGASVSMSSDVRFGHSGRTVRTQTDAQGAFSLPEIDHWFIGPFSEGIVDGEGTLRVDAAGYRDHSERHNWSKKAVTIELAPKT